MGNARQIGEAEIYLFGLVFIGEVEYFLGTHSSSLGSEVTQRQAAEGLINR
jgi:hypothetical protein